MSLATKYMGLSLPHPLVVGASPLSDDLDTVRELEDAGAAALVIRSLFEEDITGEQLDEFYSTESHGESYAEALSYAPEPESALGPDEYLEHVRRVKDAVKVPVMGSLNGTSASGWVHFARLIEEAGADGLELYIHHSVSDVSQSAAEVEAQMLAMIREVKASLRIPVAIKLPPLFTAFAHFAREIDRAGADGLVLFTRLHHADIDVIDLEIIRGREPSTSGELLLRLRGAATLFERIKASICVSGGVHSALDVIKATMTGAHATQMVSALMLNGPHHLKRVRADLEAWMTENEWSSLDEMRGNMSLGRVPDPAAYERASFRRMLR